MLKVTSGYCGGSEADPDYASVKAQRTGHRETVEVEYDPARVSYGDLFIDRGRSYTLAAYYTSGEERSVMEAKLRTLEAREGRPVFVALEPFQRFWPAEEEHQDFDLRHPEALEEELRTSGRKK